MIIEEISLQIVVSIISSLVCPIICACILWYGKRYWTNKEENQKKFEALGNGVQALLRDRILQGCHYYEVHGYSTYNSRINLTKMHEAYTRLGGNSIEMHEYNKFMDLPHKSGEEIEM